MKTNCKCKLIGQILRMSLVVTALLAILSSLTGVSRAQKSTAGVPLIVEAFDESKRVTLRGNTRPEAVRPEFDRGAVDDAFPLNGMQLQLRRPPEREQAAEALAEELHRSGSPSLHKWLTAGDYAEQFGAAPEDIAAVSQWLSAHGFTVHAPSPSRMTIDFSGTAG